jgi:cytochrome b subunit of formate dehydrogenase
MFHRLLLDHWQTALSGTLLLLTGVAMLLQILATRRMNRELTERLARLPLASDLPTRHDT